jgi:hypothetical protein
VTTPAPVPTVHKIAVAPSGVACGGALTLTLGVTTSPRISSYPGEFQDGDVGVGVGVGVFPEGEGSSDGLRYRGSPTFRTNSANRGSERIGSSKKSVFKRSKLESRSR